MRAKRGRLGVIFLPRFSEDPYLCPPAGRGLSAKIYTLAFLYNHRSDKFSVMYCIFVALVVALGLLCMDWELTISFLFSNYLMMQQPSNFEASQSVACPNA